MITMAAFHEQGKRFGASTAALPLSRSSAAADDARGQYISEKHSVKYHPNQALNFPDTLQRRSAKKSLRKPQNPNSRILTLAAW